MRTRQEIIINSKRYNTSGQLELILECLLDIREIASIIEFKLRDKE